MRTIRGETAAVALALLAAWGWPLTVGAAEPAAPATPPPAVAAPAAPAPAPAVAPAPAPAPAPAAAAAPAPAPAVAAPATDAAAKGGDAYALREKGVKALNDGVFVAATRFFQEYRDAAKGREPDLADATVLLVRSLLRQGQLNDAIQALAFHQQNSPGLADAYYQHALTYWHAAVLAAKGDWTNAVTKVTPVVADAAAAEYRNFGLELLGDAYAHLQQWPEAEKALTQLLTEFPNAENAVRAKLGLVRVCVASGQVDRAVAALAEIEKQHPDLPKLTIALYQVLIALRRTNWQEAADAYRAIESQRPQKPDEEWWLATSQLAEALIANQRHEEALSVLSQVQLLATTEGDRIQARLRIAECLIALNRVELAINTLESFRRDYPNATQVVTVELQLAELLRKTKSYVTASEYFANVANNESAPPALRYRAAVSRGWCFVEATQYENAVHAFAAAAKLGQTPDEQAEATFLAGEAAYRSENYTNAALYYQSVADNHPKTKVAERARYNQALSRGKAKLYSSAAGVYQQFIEEYPKSELLLQARLERGVALKDGGDFAKAMEELDALATQNPDAPLAPRALMEAFQSAQGADDIPKATTLLTRIVDKYPQSDLYPHALYQRAHVYFFDANYTAALADCSLFLEKFPLLPMATDVLLWLGDYHANVGDAVKSESCYLKLVTSHPQSPEAPLALYEAARSAHQRHDGEAAARLLAQLARDYPTPPPRIQAQAAILQGDILSEQGTFDQALACFDKARQLGADPVLTAKATGRLGEMYYSLGAKDPKQLEKAAECFLALARDKTTPPDMTEMARYRLAKTYEKQGGTEAAIKEYLDIVYQYSIDLKAGKVRDWYYFARSGYDAANLLVLAERYHEAARIYERLAEAKIPTAADALAKAAEIRNAHKLND